jgi:beta-lactamase class A
MKWLPVVTCSILFFVIGVLVCFWQYDLLSSLKKTSPPPKSGYSELQVRQSGYTFISPLLECEASENMVRNELSDFKSDLEAKVSTLSKDRGLSAVSIYFRDLNNGPWYGINETEAFTPASLLKMPLMIALFKQAEHDPDLLSRTVVFSPDLVKNSSLATQTVEPAERLEDGVTYTIEELIDRMIVYSDNEAMFILLSEIDAKTYDKVYSDLGLRLPSVSVSENYMTVKDYASFFRILYNASYLSKDMSEKALKLLSNTAFTGGIVDGVPSNITVSHKFGERIYGEKNESQLHDCGIIYHPKIPYLLCVMTRGDGIDEQSGVIAEISGFVYQEVSSKISR